MSEKTLSFVGDIAIPSTVSPSVSNLSCFENTTTIANLEGDIVDEHSERFSESVLFNHKSCLNFLNKLNAEVCSLSNNHILDIHSSVRPTKNKLSESKIATVGAGDNLGEASQAHLFTLDQQQYAILSFGWHVIKSKSAKINSPGVNPLYPSYVLRLVESISNAYPDAQIIVMFHWNYELELYPQPMHRKLAFEVAEVGADIVVGHHPHIVSGIETHDSTPIIYSLGNWFIPYDVYFDGCLNYPDSSQLHLAVEWDTDESLRCHWYRYEKEDHSLNYIESEPSSDSERIEQLTPYQGMSHTEYTDWFRKNRQVRSFLPVYVHPEQHRVNELKDFYCKYRQILVDKYSAIIR